MAHPYYPTGNPRFNHVAMSLPADLLDAGNRTDVCRFFDEVLGFEEIAVMTEDRRRLILSCVHWDQFIFLIAEDDPMRCPRMDHYGFAVGSLDELRGIQERAEAFRKTDDRMELIDLHMDDQTVVKIHSLYVRYILPMTDRVPVLGVPRAGGALGQLSDRHGSRPAPVRCGHDLCDNPGATSRTVSIVARPRRPAPDAQRLGHRVGGPLRFSWLRGDRHHQRRLRGDPRARRRRRDPGGGARAQR